MLSFNRPKAALYNIARLNRDIRDAKDTRDIKEGLPNRKTPIDSYS